MIYEIAVLPVFNEQITNFRNAFDEVLPLLRRAMGYQGHVLAQGVEKPGIFNLIVRWRSLEDHTPGFEASSDHDVFMKTMSPYFSSEPTVYHVEGDAFALSEDVSGDIAGTGKHGI